MKAKDLGGLAHGTWLIVFALAAGGAQGTSPTGAGTTSGTGPGGAHTSSGSGGLDGGSVGGGGATGGADAGDGGDSDGGDGGVVGDAGSCQTLCEGAGIGTCQSGVCVIDCTQ